MFIILITMAINMLILHFGAGARPTITLLLGTISVFMPNGYLLYNFAATFPVDFTYAGTKNFLLRHMVVVTSVLVAFIGVVWAAEVERWELVMKNVPEGSVLADDNVKYGMNASLMFLGGLSMMLCLVHWKRSINPLYNTNSDALAPNDEANAVLTDENPNATNSEGASANLSDQELQQL